MYKIQWLKIDANLFANRKILILLKEPDGDHILESGYNY